MIASVCTSAQTKNFIDQPYIEVNGTADTSITPDEIYIKFSISENDTKDRISIEEAETKMINALKYIGIKTEKDLTVSNMLSYYRSYFLKSKGVLKTKEYIVKVPNAKAVADVFKALEENDLSNAYIYKVDHSDLDNIKLACRVLALKQAREKAQLSAQSLSQNLGPAIHITDANQTPTNPYYGTMSEVVVTGYAMRDYETKSKTNYADIDFEKIKVNVSLNVAFVLR
jgi:uncharacterized protein YggE